MYSMLFVFFLATSALGAVCPPEDTAWFLIPHETDCSKFYICAHGVPVPQTCPDGTHFSPMHLVCQNPVFAGCDSARPELCLDWSLRARPHPDSCSKFYVCTYGSVQGFDCPQGLEFSAELLECVWPAEANCSIAPALQENPQTDASQNETVQNGDQQDAGLQDGDQQDGKSQDGGCQQGDLSPHEECSKYYVCNNEVEIAMDCPAGLQWNSEQSFCDWPVSAGCKK